MSRARHSVKGKRTQVRQANPDAGGAIHPALSGGVSSGKAPKQARGKARVARILRAASELIERHGVTGTTMSGVAELAEIPIGSLYQYFPSKSELIHRLYLDRLQVHHAPAIKALGAAVSPATFGRAFKDMMLAIYAGVRRDPLMRDVWGGMQADREIRKLHSADNEYYSGLMRQMAENSGSPLDAQTLRIRATVINELADAVLLRAITMDAAPAMELIRDTTEVGIRELGFPAEAAAVRADFARQPLPR